MNGGTINLGHWKLPRATLSFTAERRSRKKAPGGARTSKINTTAGATINLGAGKEALQRPQDFAFTLSQVQMLKAAMEGYGTTASVRQRLADAGVAEVDVVAPAAQLVRDTKEEVDQGRSRNCYFFSADKFSKYCTQNGTIPRRTQSWKMRVSLAVSQRSSFSAGGGGWCASPRAGGLPPAPGAALPDPPP